MRKWSPTNARYWLSAQPVDATQALNPFGSGFEAQSLARPVMSPSGLAFFPALTSLLALRRGREGTNLTVGATQLIDINARSDLDDLSSLLDTAKKQEELMSWPKFVLGGIAGAVFGAAVIQGLHAQAKAPAYVIIEVDVTNPDLYKQYRDKAEPLYLQFGGRLLAVGGKIDGFAGELPKRAAIVVFDSIEKAQAVRDSAAYKTDTYTR